MTLFWTGTERMFWTGLFLGPERNGFVVQDYFWDWNGPFIFGPDLFLHWNGPERTGSSLAYIYAYASTYAYAYAYAYAMPMSHA